jgi:hypothetical protein
MDGVGLRVVKGIPLLGELIAPTPPTVSPAQPFDATHKTHVLRAAMPKGVSWQAILCVEVAQAIALQQVLGDRLN